MDMCRAANQVKFGSFADFLGVTGDEINVTYGQERISKRLRKRYFTSDIALGFPSRLLSVGSDGFFPFSRFSGEDIDSESRVSTNDGSRKMGSIASSADSDLDKTKRRS